jgi:predicted polyphosphate/ATP-dependent NAD kinase
VKSFKLGFIINPIAGIGGSVALKGSDGMALQAIALGAEPKANVRAGLALSVLKPYQQSLVVCTVNGQMGEQCARDLGFDVEVLYQSQSKQTNSNDSQLAVEALLSHGVDIILFAGGDGTARDIAQIVTRKDDYQAVPVLGIPAGCKIHSGVYAITPKAAGRVIELMITKQLVSLTSGDVMDIDEELFRQGIVKAKRFGEMQIPSELRYVQAVKSGGKESDEFVLQDIAANVIEEMHDFNDRQFIIGSGSTTAFVMSELGLDNTLLGVDIVTDQRLCAVDVTEADVFKAISLFDGVSKLVITLIGGQGHIFGRGNQQLSPRVIRAIITQPGGQDNIMILATKAKLTALANKPLISDTGDATLDQVLTGFIAVTTGYKDQVLYPISSPE